MEQRAFSKINVGLAITGKRDDGYHDIDTIFQSIFLGDSLYFARHHSVVFSGDAPELPYYMAQLIPYTESNIAMKALRMVQDYTGCTQGAAIHLLKRVPPCAGMGGGSGDGAAMLLGLNKFWDLRLTDEELLTMASKLGSDVPFLLKGGTARGTGRGERLEILPTSSAQWLLIVKPEVSISTAKAYGRFTGTSRVTSDTMDTVTAHMKAKDFRQAFMASDNTFEELMFPVHPELTACKQFFLDRGFPTIMTGSGPTMVVLLEKALDAIRLQEYIKQAGYNWLSLITKTHDEEALR
ncbi:MULTISPECIES: 4-(cytidine 5'-diphospho)-2-C-methyl-D-erythritol kinase [unclassified Veillonella]|jgi:4-diphosphocytidyl-2-C-methyl-D-erythritol kinase|uniref:4-(cytidine 5'-diphospho)-2-C-methyl-D-erythritol kinase n=1 Tax=unclassified Veillonella TaxID=2630086 RepID=UPI0007860538|nr:MULTISPECIES: 4-(cytidine 5'-diphospho)-2-C-methyl-D-erythritol kinase [unclassified Veillonella]KXB89667.1 4-(cytidine 5'-diphospho)-2-C-methyl-D-erythritol kinase [Veillonella sp. DNF00869]